MAHDHVDSAALLPSKGWGALALLHHRVESALDRELRQHDVTLREYSLLELLAGQHDGPAGHFHMGQVASVVGLSQSATTRLVSRLEERGLLERGICQDDLRGVYSNLTPDGRALLDTAGPSYRRRLYETLSAAAAVPELAPLVRAVSDGGH